MSYLLIPPKKKDQFFNVCFTLSVIAMVMVLMALPYKRSAIVSMGVYMIAAIALMLIIKLLYEQSSSMPRPVFYMLALLIITVVSAFVFSSVGVWQGAIKILCFMEIPVFMLGFQKRVGKAMLPQVFLAQYVLSWHYVILSNSNRAHHYISEYGETTIKQLTLGYNNPNEAAIYLLCCFMVLCTAIPFFSRVLLKGVFAINAILVFRLLALTESRTAIFLAIVTIVALLFGRKLRIRKSYIRTALLVPVVAILAIYFFDSKLAEWKLLGFSLEMGRKNVFDQVFDVLEFHEIFVGDFATHWFANLHNVYISIFGTIGIFGAIVYALFMFSTMYDVAGDGNLAIYKKIGLVNVLLLIIQSSTEAALFVSGSAFAMSFVSVYCTAVVQEDDADTVSDVLNA